MSLEIIDPVAYPQWDELLRKSGDESVFHTAAWARVLKESYGYKPIYFTSIQDDHLSFLMPLMEIDSPLTGKRGVSLPFADSCPPFVQKEGILENAVGKVLDHGRLANWRYVEWRGPEITQNNSVSSESFITHDLDLTRTEPEIFAGLKESNRRNIRRAIKDGVRVAIKDDPDSLRGFYRLNCITRRRHGLPPQPWAFFKNLQKYMIPPGYGTIVNASYEGRVIASSIFFHFDKMALFKYGASDPRFLSHRPNNIVMWEAIKWYQARGMNTLSLGRTDVDNFGLLGFKRAWGGVERPLRYCRYSFNKKAGLRRSLKWEKGSRIFSYTPSFILRIIGRMLYRHLG